MEYSGELVTIVDINKQIELVKIHERLLPLNIRFKELNLQLNDIQTARIKLDSCSYQMKVDYGDLRKALTLRINCTENSIVDIVVIYEGENITVEELENIYDLIKKAF